MKNKCLVCTGVCKSYSKNEVLKDINLTIEPGKIYGLIGRNGAGKTTLLSIMTAQITHTEGTVTYGGERVWENEDALSDICFSRELSPMMMFGQNTLKVKDYFRMGAAYYKNWDKEYAERLIKEFNLDIKKKIYKLSKGMLSAVTIILALASRAPITILDEPVAGLDVVMRDKFYSLLLDDYAETQRTFIISTHIIEEASNLLEDVIVLNNHTIEENINTQTLISQFRYVSGNENDVDALAANFKVMHTEQMGRMKSVCLRSENGEDIEKAALGKSLDVSPVSLQKIFVYLTADKGADSAAHEVKSNG